MNPTCERATLQVGTVTSRDAHTGRGLTPSSYGGVKPVESTEGVSQIAGREFSHRAPSPFGATLSFT